MMLGSVTEVVTQRIKEEGSYQTVRECLLRCVETTEYFGGTAPIDTDKL